MVGTRWWQAAALGAGAAALLGCGSGEPGRPALRHHEMVARVEVVEEGVRSHVRGPVVSGGQAADMAPGGLLRDANEALSYPFEAMEVAAGEGVWAVIVGWEDERPTFPRLKPKGIWLFDRAWELVGALSVESVVPGEEVVRVGMAWDGAGGRLAAWVRTEGAYEVGLVDASSAGFEPILRVEGVHEGARPARLLWNCDLMILCYEGENEKYGSENVFMEIDPGSGATRRILTEERWDPSLGPMDRGCLSPDGRLLAFDRFRSPTLLAQGGRCSGIWLLDLESGECAELTYEDGSEYHHRLIGWEGPDTLVFTRRVAEEMPTFTGGGSQRDLYRLHLAEGGAATRGAE